jgi:hypothetical protein
MIGSQEIKRETSNVKREIVEIVEIVQVVEVV